MSNPIKILFLAANPSDTTRLRVDVEMREIGETLRQTKYRDNFEIEKYGAVRFFDLQKYLSFHRPHIVHFSGHGNPSNEILLEDDDGHSQPISARALSKLFEVLKDNIRCVLLNACYSEPQAQAIAEHVDCVIGMSKKIRDSASIKFAVAFYNALGNGEDIKSAFDLGCANIDSENLDEQDIPKLLAIKSNPRDIVFVSEMNDNLIVKTTPHTEFEYQKDKLPPVQNMPQDVSQQPQSMHQAATSTSGQVIQAGRDVIITQPEIEKDEGSKGLTKRIAAWVAIIATLATIMTTILDWPIKWDEITKPASCRFYGEVQDQKGTGVAGAKIEVRSQIGSNIIGLSETGAQGTFNFLVKEKAEETVYVTVILGDSVGFEDYVVLAGNAIIPFKPFKKKS